jgi:hypothetical protein
VHLVMSYVCVCVRIHRDGTGKKKIRVFSSSPLFLSLVSLYSRLFTTASDLICPSLGFILPLRLGSILSAVSPFCLSSSFHLGISNGGERETQLGVYRESVDSSLDTVQLISTPYMYMAPIYFSLAHHTSESE